MKIQSFLLSLLAASGVFMGGCASEPSDLPANKAGAAPTHPETIAVKVIGGSDGTTVTASQVSNPYFARNLTKALQRSRLFASVVPAGSSGAVFQLDVAITPLEPPAIGEQMTATVEATWTLTRVSNGYVLWKTKISGSHTTDPKEAFTGIERVRLAIEGAVGANIQDGVAQLGSASLL